MGQITEASPPSYDATVYSFDTTDPVQGGPTGVDNKAAQNLANRTGWLKAQVSAILTALGLAAPLDSPDFTGTVLVPDVPAGDNSEKAANTKFVQVTMNGLTYVSLTAGNVTLTPVQAGTGILILQGNLPAATSVIFPNTSGRWAVYNGTNGAFPVTVKTAAGPALTIPLNMTMPVWSDGTTFFSALNNPVLPGGLTTTGDIVSGHNLILGPQSGGSTNAILNFRAGVGNSVDVGFNVTPGPAGTSNRGALTIFALGGVTFSGTVGGANPAAGTHFTTVNWVNQFFQPLLNYTAANKAGDTFGGTVAAPSLISAQSNNGDPAVNSIGGFAASNSGYISIFCAGRTPLFIGSASGGLVGFLTAGNPTPIASITTNGSSVSYNTTSDRRLKRDIEPMAMADALARFDALPVHRFAFRARPNERVDGFIADEVQRVVPEAVWGEPDGMRTATNVVIDQSGRLLTEGMSREEFEADQEKHKEDVDGTATWAPGSRWVPSLDVPVWQQVDHSKLVPLLWGAVQALRAEVQELRRGAGGAA